VFIEPSYDLRFPKQKPVPLYVRLDTKCTAKLYGAKLCCSADSKDQHTNKAYKMRSPFRTDVTIPKMYSAVDRIHVNVTALVCVVSCSQFHVRVSGQVIMNQVPRTSSNGRVIMLPVPRTS